MTIEVFGTICFGLAILHTFLVKYFQHIALRFPSGSPGENFFHLLGEVEIVFGVWAGIFLIYFTIFQGHVSAAQYLDSRNFTEPLFVFVIMTVCSTKPILEMTEGFVGRVSRVLPANPSIAFYWSTLVIGPLLGSFITEPAAMTVSALILLKQFYGRGASQKLMYATIGLLFVNISIGGTLTPYAAPPVLMVAKGWGWDLSFMLTQFGWKGALAIIASTSMIAFQFRKEISNLGLRKKTQKEPIPLWINAIHLLFLFLIVASAHYLVLFIGLFMFFLGLVTVTKEFQDELKIKEGLLVAFFLGGLVILGGQQRWWLEPILAKLGTLEMYFGAIGLTAFTDNAALTYLGAQVPSLTETAKYALVAGSVVGGGLTVIANAPNPAGFGILNSSFGDEGINPLRLFISALVPTLIAAACFAIGI